MLSTADLTDLRGTATTARPDTCTISRATLATDSQGGQKDTWTDLATGVTCRVKALDQQEAERVLGEKPTSALTWELHLPQGQDVTAKDRIVVGAREFLVEAVRAARSYEIERICLCSELL